MTWRTIGRTTLLGGCLAAAGWMTLQVARTGVPSVAAVSQAAAPVAGQASANPAARFWDEATLSKPTHKVRIELNVKVPMRDGVQLSADIYRPDSNEKFPALLLRTPYSNNAQDEIADSKWYAERGYVVVNQDVRGRYDSGGQFYAYRHEANDGYDTDEWIGKQPWSNGKIGTVGGSYLGYTQVTQGIRGSRFLTAMAAEVTSTDIYDGWVYVDGAFHLGFTLPWGAGTIDGHTSQNGPGDWSSYFSHLPLATADAPTGHVTPHYRDWLAHADRSDPYWNDISFEREAQKISVPLLIVEGWYDIFLRGALRDDVVIRKSSATKLGREGKRLVIGPWGHTKNSGSRYNERGLKESGFDRRLDFGPEAEFARRNMYLRWNDYWLKGIDNGVAADAPVKLFVMGANQWRDEQEWPLARTQYTKYYITSGGRANTASGDGVLATVSPGGTAPATAAPAGAPSSSAAPSSAATDTFTYDPASPVPTLGGNVCCSSVPSGPRDHSKLEQRDDVLVYTTPALTEAVEVTGPIVAKLFAATSAKDTDWVVRLIDLHPDGYAQNVQDGILRARYRAGKGKPASLLEPGKVYEYDIDMWASSNVFLPGHRIRVEITSSNFPRFDRNLNTGENPATGTRMETAKQTIYHSAQYPSHLVLPIIPAARPASTAGGR